MESELHSFIKDSLAKGLAKDKIREVLLQANWEKDEVDVALNRYADINFPIAVPKRKPYLSAREAFMYLLTYVTLYVSSFNLGALIYQFINRAFPDATIPVGQLYDAAVNPSGIRFNLASLIIAFPIYLWLTIILNRSAAKNPEARSSRVRKWLTYLTLFVTVGVMIGDLIALLNRLFNGDITMRFGLKFLTVLVIAGVVFVYYLRDLRKEETTNAK
ncbi:MAG: DUF5671 domain-containing protein [Candidatus Komeilibacteria bacterium]